MKIEILKKEVSFATEKEINYLLKNIIIDVKNEFDKWGESLNEDELIDEYMLLKKDIVYVIKSDITLNNNENFKLFDVFFLGKNFDMTNLKLQLKNGKINDVSQADFLFKK